MSCTDSSDFHCAVFRGWNHSTGTGHRPRASQIYARVGVVIHSFIEVLPSTFIGKHASRDCSSRCVPWWFGQRRCRPAPHDRILRFWLAGSQGHGGHPRDICAVDGLNS